MRHVTGGEGTCEGESRETLRDGCGLCEGRGGEGRAEECVVMWFQGFSFFVGGSEVPALRLQLEAHAHFVSAGVEVLPVDQGWEGDLHACGDTEQLKVSQTVTQVNQLMDKPAAYTSQFLS